MIDIKLLEKKAESGASYFDEYKQGLINRGASTEVLEQIVELNKKRREMITVAESEKAKQNKLSGEIGKLKREGGDVSAIMGEVEKLKGTVKDLETKAAEIDLQVTNIALTMPNKPHSTVPVGASEKDNKITKTIGTPPTFSFKAKEHWELGESLDIIDFERAGKTTGTRFAFLKGAAAQMERALIQFMMDMHSMKHGYTEMIPPFMVNSSRPNGGVSRPSCMQIRNSTPKARLTVSIQAPAFGSSLPAEAPTTSSGISAGAGAR